ncbi:MAG: response regulator [Armatimonadota bacterium]
MSQEKKTILIVEDERNLRSFYEQELRTAGYDVIGVDGGIAAVEVVGREKVDLVVLDIGMPDMDGLEAMRKMLDKNRKLPIVLNTAYEAFKDDFMSWAAEAYILKSADPKELLDTIASILAKASARDS